jgi:hypothetical protein
MLTDGYRCIRASSVDRRRIAVEQFAQSCAVQYLLSFLQNKRFSLASSAYPVVIAQSARRTARQKWVRNGNRSISRGL